MGYLSDMKINTENSEQTLSCWDLDTLTHRVECASPSIIPKWSQLHTMAYWDTLTHRVECVPVPV